MKRSPHFPIFIAHRGESYLAPENTHAAFQLAWSLGDDVIELDVHVTRDRKVIICHDVDTHRITGGKSRLVIRESTADELRRLDVGGWKDVRFAGEQMPLLAEVIERIPPGKQAFIEIKPEGTDAVEEVIAIIRASARPICDITIISFHDSTVARFKQLWPDDPKACLLSGFSQDSSSAEWLPTLDQLISRARDCCADGLDIQNKPPVDASFIAQVHGAGLMCHIWTEDDPESARRFIAAGVDGVTTNRAHWLQKACT